MDFTVTIETDTRALEQCLPEWETLAAAALEPNPFFEHWLLLPALRAFSATDDVRIICIRRGQALCGLLPFQLIPRYRGALPFKALTSWRNPHGLLGTPLVARDRGAECLAALFRWLPRQRLARIVEFTYLPAGGPFHQALADGLKLAGHVARSDDIYTRGLLRREHDAETYMSSALSGAFRRKLRRCEKRLQEQGRVERRVLKPGDDVQRWIEEFLHIEASGWKGARGTAVACSDSDRRFVTEAFTAAFERERLIMVGIDLDGRPIARYSGFVAREGAFAFKTTYEEGCRRFAPGLLAELDMIRALHALPDVRWMDSIAGHSNSTIDRFWKHRLAVQRVAVGVGTSGELLVLVVLPLLQWANRVLRRLGLRLRSNGT